MDTGRKVVYRVRWRWKISHKEPTKKQGDFWRLGAVVGCLVGEKYDISSRYWKEQDAIPTPGRDDFYFSLDQNRSLIYHSGGIEIILKTVLSK